MVYLGDGWGDVVLPSPGSEPPPPYSPPRVPHHHQHFFPQGFASSPHNHHHHPPHHYYHNHISDYYDVSPTRSSQPSSLTLSTTGSVHPYESLSDKSMKDPPPPYPPTPFKSTHPALNHGPSSAFSPPTKSIKYSYPPPYTPWTDPKNGSLGSYPGKASSPPPISVTSTFSTTPHHVQPHSDLGSRNTGGLSAITSPRNRIGREHHQLHPDTKSRSLGHGESRRHHRLNGCHTEETRSVSGSHRGHSLQVRGHNGNISCVSDSTRHPKGPLLKTGKSLELPNERLSFHHDQSFARRKKQFLHPHHSANQAHHRISATAHIHPGHSSHHQHPTKDFKLRQTKESHGIVSKSNKLAYVGILTSEPYHIKHVRGKDIRSCERPKTLQICDRLREPLIDCKKMKYDDRWVRRTSRLEAAAAQSMMPVRAIPVTAVNGPTPQTAFRKNYYGRDYEEGSLSCGRLRSYRSLDELSDLLDEDLPRLPVATTRSLDDLTEPLYENLDAINAHARSLQNARIAHNTSVPDLLDPPPRPPRQRNSSLSSLLDDLAHTGANTTLSRRTLNTSVPDVLERGIGGRAGERGMNGLHWHSSSSTLRSATSTLLSNVSTTSTLRSTVQEADNTSDIGVQLQKIREVARVLDVKYRNGELSSSSGSSSMAPSTHTSPRIPNPGTLTTPMQAPGVPARAPVIHDVLRDGRKSSPQQPEADVASQESGYSSMDSRSCKQQTGQYEQTPSQHTLRKIDSGSVPYERCQYANNFNEQDIISAQHLKKHSSEGTQIKPSEFSLPHNRHQWQIKQNEHLVGNERKQLQNPSSHYHSEKQNSSKWDSGGFRHHLPHVLHQPNNAIQQLQSSQDVAQRHPNEFSVQQIENQQGVNQDKLGIYIKSVVPGGAADQDGRLQAGDQLLTVDGKSLIGITQERAAEYMMETGPVVTLEVARQGAIYHGLATILSQPSPQTNRASLRKMRPRTEETTRAAMTNSQSTPNMGGYNERLVDWNQPPRQHPLPPTSSHNSLLARSSPNLAAPAEGTDVNHLTSTSTNKPVYSQSKLSPLRASLPSLAANTSYNNNNNPLYPPPLISVIPSERVEVGIEHRTLDFTRSNPDLPKYTFTPPSETSSTSCNTSSSSSSSISSSSWRRQQRGVGHGAGCAAVRRGSGPPNLAADSGINLSCHVHDDAKPWKSLVDVTAQGEGKSGCDSRYDQISVASAASSSRPTRPPVLVSRTSYPLLPSRPPLGPSTDISYNKRRPTLRQQMSIAPTIAQSSPSLLLLHSPPSTPQPSQAYPSQPQSTTSAAPIGYPGGRHLSERDLPSKVLREHNQEPPSHPHQAPRMQSSKSVPSLNSDAGSSVGGKAASLEVFNPSYSRTSSNTSLSQPPSSHIPPHQHHHLQQQQQQQPPIRSRSIQNLSDGSYQGAVGRHPSNPNLVVEEERYYQNVNFHQGMQDPRMGSTRTRPVQPLPMSSPISQGSSEQQRTDNFRSDPRTELRPASAFMQRDEMILQRSDLQRPASQRDIRADAKMIEMTEEVRRREDRMRLNGHAATTTQQRSSAYQPSHRLPNAPYSSVGTSFSSEGFSGQQGFPVQHQGYHPVASQAVSPQAPMAPPQHAHVQYSGQPHGFPGKHPPPTAPKPKSQGISQPPLSPEAPEKPSRQYGYDGMGIGIDGPPRPPPPEDGYRDSPPPPPPPTSTHPLLQGSRPTSSVGFTSAQIPNKSVFSSSSPWDREEKDRNDRRRREAVKHWRDEQISSLEALELRTSQQDERLRTLRLEKEFQRRAEEALSNDDDDDEDEDEDDDIAERNESDKVNARQGPEAGIRDENKPLPSTPVIPLGQEPRMNGGGPVDDERARRVDEIRRKQQELEAASEAEERLLREAQRRQQEEQIRQKQQQTAPSQHLHYQHQHHASQRLDSLVATPFQSQYNNGPVNGMRGSSHGGYQEHIGVAPENRNRIDSVVSSTQHSPVPPERGSSYTVMQQQTPSSSTANTRSKSSDSSSATIKRVQFSETPAADTHITYDSNANQEKTPQDPNNFINEAETLLNSSPTRSIGGTPGVIGAQEVYRDPRMRRLQQKQAEQAAAKNPGPEKLTFKEKMKMFAMETGEGETPKDKVKISRAQRDIEH